MSAAPPSANDRVPYPTRFSWPMRLFLAFLLFDMVFRSFSVCFPWGDWGGDKDLDMRLMPVRLPTRAEVDLAAARRTDAAADPVAEDFFVAFDSVWEFFKPWPEPKVRPKLTTWASTGKWGLVWLTSRLEFLENVAGINEEWPMFSPGVGKKRYVARARLVYNDGSEKTVRGKCDPEDLTRYSHWFQEKVLDHELKVKEGRGRASDAFGYCNLLSHRHARNEGGAQLARIHLYVVRYDLPPPDRANVWLQVEARQWLKDQSGPPSEQVYADFYVFDARKRHGECLIHRYD